MAFKSPNHTQTPNDLFDVHLKNMTEAEVKVVLVIIRQTLGWHKKKDPISLSMFAEKTGMSRPTCKKGLDAAIERGLINAEKRKGRTTIYSMSIIDDAEKPDDQLNILPSTRQDSLLVPAVGLVKEFDTQKKESKERKETAAPRKSPSKQSSAAACRDTVKSNHYYQAYRAVLLSEMVDPQSVTLKNAPAWKDVIDALDEAGVQEDKLCAYILSRQKRLDTAYRFEWLAEDIDRIKPPPPPMPQPPLFVPVKHEGMTKEQLDALVIPEWEEILEMTDPAKRKEAS